MGYLGPQAQTPAENQRPAGYALSHICIPNNAVLSAGANSRREDLLWVSSAAGRHMAVRLGLPASSAQERRVRSTASS